MLRCSCILAVSTRRRGAGCRACAQHHPAPVSGEGGSCNIGRVEEGISMSSRTHLGNLEIIDEGDTGSPSSILQLARERDIDMDSSSMRSLMLRELQNGSNSGSA